MRLLLLILPSALLFTSCKKDSIGIVSIWQCNSVQNLDSAAISKKITGSWKWMKYSCFDAGKNIVADKNIKVTFNTNLTFTVFENTSIVSQGNWVLKIIDSNIWGVELSLPSDYLYGRILFCGNQLLFNNSYKDGCDNLFLKQD